MSGAGCITTNRARSYDSHSSEPPQRKRISETKPPPEVGHVVDVYLIRTGIRGFCSLLAQIVLGTQRPCARLLVFSFFALAIVGSNANGADGVTDVTLHTGVQLKEQIDLLPKKYPEVGVGFKYFADQKLYPNPQGLAELNFRAENKPELYTLFFIPMSGETPAAQAGQPSDVNIELAALDAKGIRVVLGTVSSDGKQFREVKNDRQVLPTGKVESSDYLKRFFKCTAEGCVGAAGCLFSGPAAIPCFCLSCGAVAGGCSLLEYFFP